MKSSFLVLTAALFLTACANSQPAATQDGWISLFNGRDLTGWRASENPSSFSVQDGVIVVDGPRAHLYYVGDVLDHNFKNFEFKADVMTEPGANSGIYFHTAYQDDGWPSKGYEVQVNNSHTDWRRTGSLYGIDDVREVPAQDGEWYTEHIIVQGNRITTKVNGETLVEYVEPEDVQALEGRGGRYLSSGTFALQAHDPESVIYYKNIMVRPLPD